MQRDFSHVRGEVKASNWARWTPVRPPALLLPRPSPSLALGAATHQHVEDGEGQDGDLLGGVEGRGAVQLAGCVCQVVLLVRGVEAHVDVRQQQEDDGPGGAGARQGAHVRKAWMPACRDVATPAVGLDEAVRAPCKQGCVLVARQLVSGWWRAVALTGRTAR